MKKYTIINIILALCLLAAGILVGRLTAPVPEETTPVTIPETVVVPETRSEEPAEETEPETTAAAEEPEETEAATEAETRPGSSQPSVQPPAATEAPEATGDPEPGVTEAPVQGEDELPIVPA